ncbi:unnamed protein product, partial [Rotaria sp. Silwood1]
MSTDQQWSSPLVVVGIVRR